MVLCEVLVVQCEGLEDLWMDQEVLWKVLMDLCEVLVDPCEVLEVLSIIKVLVLEETTRF